MGSFSSSPFFNSVCPCPCLCLIPFLFQFSFSLSLSLSLFFVTDEPVPDLLVAAFSARIPSLGLSGNPTTASLNEFGTNSRMSRFLRKVPSHEPSATGENP